MSIVWDTHIYMLLMFMFNEIFPYNDAYACDVYYNFYGS